MVGQVNWISITTNPKPSHKTTIKKTNKRNKWISQLNFSRHQSIKFRSLIVQNIGPNVATNFILKKVDKFTEFQLPMVQNHGHNVATKKKKVDKLTKFWSPLV